MIMNMSEPNATIFIPLELVKKIEKRIENTEFNSVSAYITYILNVILSNIENSGLNEDKSEFCYKKKVKERLDRLESLGYLD